MVKYYGGVEEIVHWAILRFRIIMAKFQSSGRTRVPDSGPVLPAAPYSSQLFQHTPVGRSILYQWNGIVWVPQHCFVGSQLYVDNVLGTDNMNFGTGPGIDAFATIAYALSVLPKNMDHDILSHSIRLSQAAYVENLTALGYRGSIHITAGLQNVASLVATGGAQGAGAVPPSVTGGFVPGVYNNLLIHFTSGANDGEYRVIGLTTAGTLYLVGNALPAAPVNNDTYEVLTWGASLTGHQVILDCNNFNFEGLDIIGNVGDYAIYGFMSNLSTYLCRMTNNGTDRATLYADAHTAFFIYTCLNRITGGGDQVCAQAEWGGIIDNQQSRYVGRFPANDDFGILTARQAVVSVSTCEFLGCWAAVNNGQNSTGDFLQAIGAGTVTNFIHGNNIGVRAFEHSYSFRMGAAYITFGTDLSGAADPNVGVDTQADAPSFSWQG